MRRDPEVPVSFTTGSVGGEIQRQAISGNTRENICMRTADRRPGVNDFAEKAGGDGRRWVGAWMAAI